MTTENYKMTGLQISEIVEKHNWHFFPAPSKDNFVEALNCPIDKALLKSLVVLTSAIGSQKIRLGVCPDCGYLGYMDRPNSNWFKKFYENQWDFSGKEQTENTVKKIQKTGFLKKDKLKGIKLLEVLSDLKIDKSKAILDFGCGYGGALGYIKKEGGYENLLGIENSSHRAAVAKECYGLEFLEGVFGDDDLQVGLKKKGPFSVIMSHHVLEHVVNPSVTIKKCHELQNDGDCLILSLPNLEGEFSMSPLFYLPHLHSYRIESIRALLSRNRYSIIDESRTTSREIYVVARKDSDRRKLDPSSKNFVSLTYQKFVNAFGLDRKFGLNWETILWGHRYIDIGGQFPVPKIFPKAKLIYFRAYVKYKEMSLKSFLAQEAGPKAANRGLENISFFCRPLSRFSGAAPIEIQYAKELQLAVK